jgi:hypothetical protein
LDSEGLFPLFYCGIREDPSIIRDLLKYSTEIGCNCLDLAIQGGHMKKIQYIAIIEVLNPLS